MSLPYMPLYIADYLKDTGHLSAAEHGAYLLLIMHYWANGCLPASDVQKARIARMSEREWKTSRDTLAEFFDGNEWKHCRIDVELAIAAEKNDARAAAGRAGGLAAAKARQKAKQNPSNASSNATVLPLANEQQNPSIQIQNTETEEERSHPAGGRVRYSAGFEGFWKAYPRTPIMSKAEAWKAWGRLPEADREAASAAVAGYRSFLASKPDHPAVHACRFLSQRRFDGFAEIETAPLATIGFYAASDSAELAAWDAHSRATRGKNNPRDRNGGWRFPSQWPPNHQQQATG